MEKNLKKNVCTGFLGGASGKEPTCQGRKVRAMGWIPRLGRSPGGGHGNPFQYSCLENLWTGEPGGLHRVSKSRTQLK